MRGQIHRPDLRPLFGDKLRLDPVTRQDLPEGLPIVAAIGIVGIDAGHPLELALEILDRQQRSHHRFAFVIGRAENVARIRHHLLDAVLGGAVPHHQKRLLFLRHRRDPKADAGRDQSMNRLDLFLQNQTPKALDRIFWIGLFFEHQFDFAPGDPAVLVHPLGRPLHRANSALARGAGGAGPRRNNSNPQRLVLRQGRREQSRHRCCQDAGACEFGKISARELHRSLPLSLALLSRACCHTINISERLRIKRFFRSMPANSPEKPVARLIDW